LEGDGRRGEADDHAEAFFLDFNLGHAAFGDDF